MFRAETKEEVVVSLAQINVADKPELHWQPVSLKTGLQLKVTPVLENAKGAFALTRSNVDEIRKNHTVRKAKVDKQWNDLRERGLALQKQFKDVEKRLVTTPAQINARQKELVRLSNQIAVLKKEFDKVDADKQTVDGVLAAVPAVDELIGRLHNVAKIPYRVVAKAGPVEIELIRATE